MSHQYSTVDTPSQRAIATDWIVDAPPAAGARAQAPLKKRIDSLQSMRLVASLAVFQYHVWINYLGRSFVHPGTDFFIVLVGLVAALSDSGKIAAGHWKQYILGRYLRLYVTFLPVFLFYVLAGRDELTPLYLVRSFFFIPSPGRMPLVGPSWMLGMFLAFYWVFSLSILFRREWSLIPIFLVWGIGSVLVPLLDIHFSIFDKGIQLLFNLRSLEFIAGYAIGWLVRNRRISGALGKKLLAAGLLLLLIAAFLLNSSGSVEGMRVVLYGASMTAIAGGLAGMEQDGMHASGMRFVLHPWLVWLGGASYVLYLTHNMLLRIWDTLLPITIWQVPLVTALGLLLAGLGYQFWEKPVLEFLRRRLLR